MSASTPAAANPWAELALPLTCPLCAWEPPAAEQLPAPSPSWPDALPPVVTALLEHLAAEQAELRREGWGRTEWGRAALASVAARQQEVYATAQRLRAAPAARTEQARRRAHVAALLATPWCRPGRPARREVP